ncbi:proton-coupled amino acid transporter 1-like isoform X3 [Diachasmimorpha longicaudata]|uniref:proton-coupled amino acid transporter 1-like isoform X3 n=1 Tax=Diachasmimorpha longicaudata TaxID=58733 RepID=UPI0030B8EB52
MAKPYDEIHHFDEGDRIIASSLRYNNMHKMELQANPTTVTAEKHSKLRETAFEGSKISVDGAALIDNLPCHEGGIARQNFCPLINSGNGDNYGVFRSNDPILAITNRRTSTRSQPDHITADHPTSYCETMMHLFKGNVGSGIFALGDAFKNAGLLLAPPLTIFLGIICVHAQHILLNCNDEVIKRLGDSAKQEAVGYAGTVEMCFEIGPLRLRKYSVLMRKMVNLFVCVTQLGFCCVYFVFISTNMQQVLDQYGFHVSVGWHMAIALVPILMSTWIRSLKFLTPLSSIANLLVVFGYIATVYIICNGLPALSERNYVASWNQLPLFFGTVIYSFEGITLVLPLKNEMKKPTQFNSPLGVLNTGMVIVGMMFVVMGFLAYLQYGEDVRGSVTLNLNSKEILPQCIKIAISLCIMLSYALQFYVPVAIIWPKLMDRFGEFRCPVLVETCFRSALCLLTFVLAEAIPNLGNFISLVGAVSSTALALLFPPIIELVVCAGNNTLGPIKIMKNVFILLIGLLGFLTGTYESLTKIIDSFSESSNSTSPLNSSTHNVTGQILTLTDNSFLDSGNNFTNFNITNFSHY